MDGIPDTFLNIKWNVTINKFNINSKFKIARTWT